MRKLFSAILLLISIVTVFSQGNLAYAQTSVIESIDIDVMIHEDGSAEFVEVWRGEFYDFTELYYTKENLGKSEIKDFTVTRNGEPYDFVGDWKVDASFEEKAFKNGFNKIKGGLEMNWGLSEEGPAEYVLKYRVTNFVKQAKGDQFTHWTFLNDHSSMPRQEARLSVKTSFPLTIENANAWMFGMDGDVEFINGEIVSQSYSPLITEDYLMLLIRYDDGMFKATEKVKKKFKKIEKEAFKDSEYTEGFFRDLLADIADFFSAAFGFVILGAVILLGFLTRGSYGGGRQRKFRRKFKEEYYRDYPYEGDYLDAYYVVHTMGLANFNTLLTSMLLKWIKEGMVRTSEETSGMLRRKRQHIYFLKDDVEKKTEEGKMYNALKILCGDENYVTDRQVANWAERSHKALTDWENRIKSRSINKLSKAGYMKVVKKGFFIFKANKYELTEKGKELEERVYKYVNYLHDFSLLSEQDAINVHLWDEIMIWAAYLDLTDVVSEQFKKVYPRYEEESRYGRNNIRRTRDFAAAAEASRRKAARAERRRARRGEGGRGSRRGGGTSYGGGSGMGGR